MKSRQIMMLAVLCGGMGVAIPFMDGGCAKADDLTAGDPGKAMGDFSKDSQAIYKKVSGSMVRVRIEGGMGSQLLKDFPQLLKEFEEWRAKQPGGAGGIRRPRPHGDSDASTTMPAHNGPGGGMGQGQLFRKFLDQKLGETTDKDVKGRLNGLIARMDAARAVQGGPGEVMGVMIDDQGNTLIACGPLRESAGATFHVTGPDGTEVAAKYVGAHLGRGVAVIKLESAGILTPMALATGRPTGGELLMCMTARQGAVGWITAPGAAAAAPAISASAGKKGTDERFAIMGGDDHDNTYLFNTKGELAAIGTEKFAMPVEVLKDDIQWIIANGKDIAPLRLGVKYVPVRPEKRKEIPSLGFKAAVVVEEVTAGSPAEKAGVKKDDILLTIDDVSIALFPQIQTDLATRTGSVPVGIIRGGVEKTLEMPLGEK